LVEEFLLFDIGNEALVALASWSKIPVVYAAYLSVESEVVYRPLHTKGC